LIDIRIFSKVKMNKNKKHPEEIPFADEDEIFKFLTNQMHRNIIRVLEDYDNYFSQNQPNGLFIF
jgi:hypothetical protein